MKYLRFLACLLLPTLLLWVLPACGQIGEEMNDTGAADDTGASEAFEEDCGDGLDDDGDELTDCDDPDCEGTADCP